MGSTTASPLSPDKEGAESREDWIRQLERVVRPVVSNLAAATLRANMPVESSPGMARERQQVTHLEAVGRTLAGLAPWLTVAANTEGANIDEAERRLAREFAVAARQGLANAVDNKSPDYLNFAAGRQNLVDAAFLCLGLLRAPQVLWHPLPEGVKHSLIAAVKSTRPFEPAQNNWLLFAAIIEAWLESVGTEWRADRVEPALSKHEEWYQGDGTYGDGPEFHWDYYNSYVIQPMLVEVIERLGPREPKWAAMHEAVIKRAVRFAAIQERMIAADGAFPPVGRSITYRGGAFHHLAFMALRRQLPESLAPAQVRGALAATHRRTLDAPNTFDKRGWLRIGLAGHQPALAERYISTGSLYLCTASFLPLGLPPDDPFWSAPRADWTQRRIWAGHDAPIDQHLKS